VVHFKNNFNIICIPGSPGMAGGRGIEVVTAGASFNYFLN